MDFCHIPVSIIQRSKGRSAVAAAAYRSGTKLTNEWDGLTHDYTRKTGVVHSEIMLPAHAPPEFTDRSTLWNSVEQIEKARDSQLAREIEAALPRELTREQQLALVRAYVKDKFVDKGMCADFSIHDKGTGNPHVHIMLTVRPLKEDGAWGAKCRKAYDLDEHGQRIPDGKGGWKNHREDTTDWNDKPYLFGSDIYANESAGEDYDIPGEALADPDFAALIAEAEKYLGFPYVWGGSSPSTSFDCSGFVCYVYTHSGVHNLPRTTAQGIYNQCAHIPMSEAKPGDIIFFTGTYNSPGPVSHVGIYVGNNMMIHCGSPIQYARTDSSYWSQHFYAIGRLN